MNVAEQLIEEGRQKGRAEKQRTILLKLLRVRFGEPPEDVVARVMSADEVDLDRWTDRAMTELTLAQVFNDEPGDPRGE